MGNHENGFDRYRMDNRTVDEFQRDIERGTAAERDIVDRYVRYYEKHFGTRLEIVDNGCDNSGQFLTRGAVSMNADFIIGGKPVEVKFNKQTLTKFHFKAAQLEAYAKQGASVLWVNGYETRNPVFMVLKSQDLFDIKERLKPVPQIAWGGKLSYVLFAKDYHWTRLY